MKVLFKITGFPEFSVMSMLKIKVTKLEKKLEFFKNPVHLIQLCFNL